MDTIDIEYDVAVIGGGPAGMMAAGRAAEQGARVILLEKNASLGKKLRITGGGRCNILNAELDVKKLIAKYGKKGEALFGAFARFGVADTMRFFESRGLPLKIEEGNRAFPASDKADDVWNVMTDYMKKGNVRVVCVSAVTGLESKKGAITGVRTSQGSVTARNYVLATGGKSRPETGSTGEGFSWLTELGHSVEEPDAALVPITIQETWVKKLSGLSFAQAKLSVLQGGKKQFSKTGKILFTHFGLSGPLVLNMSKSVRDLQEYEPVTFLLDLFPDLDTAALDVQVLDHFNTALNKKIRNTLGGIVPPMMVSTLLEMVKIDSEKQANAVTKAERTALVTLLKALPMSVSGFLGAEKAIVTSGGVSLKEIDFKTMQSKLFNNLYLVGDVLDFDRPTGGYSLQICWTTGYLAGENSAR